MPRGFVYRISIVDWFSRRVLSWRLSSTPQTDFCIEALEEALTRFGAPEIINTYQSGKLTSIAFTSVLDLEKIAICMDGRGAWRDNVFVERPWRLVKYEEIYLRAYGLASEARSTIGRNLTFYNGRHPYSSLDRKTPDHLCFNQPFLAAECNWQPLHLEIARSCSDKPSHLWHQIGRLFHIFQPRLCANYLGSCGYDPD
jgi:putative transposase